MSETQTKLLASLILTGISACICFVFSLVIVFFVQILGSTPPPIYVVNYWALLAMLYYVLSNIGLSGGPNGKKEEN